MNIHALCLNCYMSIHIFYFENLCYNYRKRLQNTRGFNEYDEE